FTTTLGIRSGPELLIVALKSTAELTNAIAGANTLLQLVSSSFGALQGCGQRTLFDPLLPLASGRFREGYSGCTCYIAAPNSSEPLRSRPIDRHKQQAFLGSALQPHIGNAPFP